VIRAVTFDFWGTLYTEGDAEAARKGLRAEYARNFLMGLGHEVTAQQIDYAFEIVWNELYHEYRTNHVGYGADDIGSGLARAVGVTLGGDDAVRLGELVSAAGREQPPMPLPGARDVVAALAGHVRLGLISDTGYTLGHDLYAVMEADGFAQLIEQFTFSNQTRTTKPEVRQFHHTLHRLDRGPEESVHVGDLEPTDVAGAKAAGMRAVRIVHDGEDPATIADASVERIADVLDVLRGWGLGCGGGPDAAGRGSLSSGPPPWRS